MWLQHKLRHLSVQKAGPDTCIGECRVCGRVLAHSFNKKTLPSRCLHHPPRVSFCEAPQGQVAKSAEPGPGAGAQQRTKPKALNRRPKTPN